MTPFKNCLFIYTERVYNQHSKPELHSQQPTKKKIKPLRNQILTYQGVQKRKRMVNSSSMFDHACVTLKRHPTHFNTGKLSRDIQWHT